jgi:threonine dehydrogenase-like Zn-dependent dehydrogenase
MRQALFTGPGQLTIEEAPIPAPSGREVLVRVEACGVCGSDRAIFAGHHPLKPPVVLGHEYAGVVEATGPEVRQLRAGDRVVIDPNIMCGTCSFCRRGMVQLCVNITPLGISRPGGFAEYSLVPEPNAYLIPDTMSFDQAALVEPLACCVRGINQADVRLAATVVVLGAGPIGLMLAQLARLRGAGRVVCVEPSADRRALAQRLAADITLDGADPATVQGAVQDLTHGLGADVVIEASGRTSAAQLTLDLVQAGGTIVWFGACPEHDRVAVPPFRVNDREITVRGSNINPFTHQTALTLIERGRVLVDDLVSDHLSFEALQGALDPTQPAPRGKPVLLPGARS